MKPDPNQINRQAYNQIAHQFATLNATMPESVFERAMSLLAKIKQGGRILDLGCGPGRDIAWFEARGRSLIGADLSIGMLKEAQNVVQAPVCLMDMRQLGFAQASFSAVWCNAALLHLPKGETLYAIHEIARVLIPGGYFFFSLQEGNSEGVETSPQGNIQRFFSRFQAGDLTDLLSRAGFCLLQTTRNSVDLQTGLTWLWFEAQRGK